MSWKLHSLGFVCFIYIGLIKFDLGLLRFVPLSRQRHLCLNKGYFMGYSMADGHAFVSA